MNNKYAHYQNNSVMTASPQELTLMLYNGAIRFCNQCIEAIERKDVEKGHYYCMKVQDIIVELQATLDDRYEIAKEYDALYTFIRELLLEANMEKNIVKMEQAKELITEFRDLWKVVIEKVKVQNGR